MRRWRLGLMLVLVFTGATSVFAVARRPNGPVPFPVEAGHPYADAVSAFNRLKPEERDALVSSVSDAELSGAVLEARGKIAAAVALGREGAPQWTAVHDPLAAGYDPDFLKTLSSLAAVRSVVAQRQGDAAAGDAATLDGLALYLSVGSGLSTEDWSRQQDLVTTLLGRLQTRAGKLSPDEAADLLAELRALPPLISFADMVRSDPLWKTPGSKLRRALERKARAMGFKSDRIDPADLRMTGLAVEGARAAVSFETPAGAFWLEAGQDRYGVALRELDIPGRQARILFEGREAVIQLKSRRIERWDDVLLEGAVKGLAEESDFLVGLFLDGRKQTVSLSEHLAKLDEFGQEADALARDVAEGAAGPSEPEALAERLSRLQALAPWPDFKSEEFAQGLFHAKAQGEKTEAEWRKTMETLERAAGAPRVKEAPPEVPSR